jgi:hypothetical protein
MNCIRLVHSQCTHPELAPLRPTGEQCAACPHYRGPARGLGDVVANVTHAVGIRPCGGCQKRREALNEISKNLLK